MELHVDLDLDGLEKALSAVLPFGIQPLRLRLDASRLRLDARAPLLGEVALLAEVRARPGELILSGFDLEGAGLARALALQKLREAVAGLDRRWPPLRAFGEAEGDRLHLSWA